MPQRLDERLIANAADHLVQFPGLGPDLSRRDSLRLMVSGLLAGVMGPSIAGLVGQSPASADTGAGPSQGGRAGPQEELLVCYFAGRGKFSEDMTLINLNMTMYDLDGHAIGTQHGVHESTSTPEDLFGVPPMPAPPFDAPPVPHEPVKEWTKGIWTFADGSGVYAVGPARSRIVPLKDGSCMFMVTTGQTITSGIGRYANAYGVKQATGSAYIPPGVLQSGFFPQPGMEFDARTIEVFRIFVPKAR
jgi:hypothetical protein